MDDSTTVGDRYRIIEGIASGGMGEVFRARDTVLGREVAIKILHRSLAGDAEFIDRFRREAQAAASLNHPNIVAVYDWGDTGDTYFMVMELIAGRTVRELLSNLGSLQSAQASDVMRQTLAALDHAHRQGIVHRDVKPENLLVTADGTVKVADFGLARAYAESRVTTAPGTVTGTVAYLAPEQIRGEPADPRTDLYALGVVGFELLTGAVPYKAETSVAVAYKHLEERVPPPSSVDPSVPPELDAVIIWATEKDPADRPATAADLHRELTRLTGTLAAAPTLAVLVGELPRIDIPLNDQAMTVTIPRAGATAAPATTPSGANGATTAAIPLGQPTTVGAPGIVQGVAQGVVQASGSPGGTRAGLTAESGEEPAPRRRRKRGRIRRYFRWLLILAVIVLAGWIAWRFFVPKTVPNVLGLQPETAQEVLEDTGFDVSIGAPVFSDEFTPGSVAEQSILGGTTAKPGDAIQLSPSRGPETVTVPRVLDRPEEEARAALAQAALTVGEVTHEFSDAIGEGNVISQLPQRGERVPGGSTIALVISDGPPPATVPGVVGLEEEAAVASLESQGLRVDRAEKFTENVDRGLVISQSLPDGEVVDRGRRVRITVSLGPKKFPMPDLTVGLTPAQAMTRLKELGLTATTETVPGSGGSRVVGQSPSAGATVSAGDRVTLFLGD